MMTAGAFLDARGAFLDDRGGELRCCGGSAELPWQRGNPVCMFVDATALTFESSTTYPRAANGSTKRRGKGDAPPRGNEIFDRGGNLQRRSRDRMVAGAESPPGEERKENQEGEQRPPWRSSCQAAGRLSPRGGEPCPGDRGASSAGHVPGGKPRGPRQRSPEKPPIFVWPRLGRNRGDPSRCYLRYQWVVASEWGKCSIAQTQVTERFRHTKDEEKGKKMGGSRPSCALFLAAFCHHLAHASRRPSAPDAAGTPGARVGGHQNPRREPDQPELHRGP